MALALTDESFGRFSTQDFVQVGKEFNLPEKAVTGMIEDLIRRLTSAMDANTPPPIVTEAVTSEIRNRCASLPT